MPHDLSAAELRRVAPAEIASFRSSVPTQSNVRYGYVHRGSAIRHTL